MDTLKDLFEHDFMGQALHYNLVPVFTGVQTLENGHILGDAELTVRVRYNMSIDVIQLAFYVTKTPSLSDLIIITLGNIDYFKDKAKNDVKPKRVYDHEVSFGNKSPIVSDTFFFYSEIEPTNSDVERLTQYCSDKPYMVFIRGHKHFEYQFRQKKKYAFISHDSRDKDLIARPIAEVLIKRSCPVWYDEYTLEIGQNLRESIERGIRECDHSILIITKNFLTNPGWTKEEFDSIYSKKMITGQHSVLPIWYGVTAKEVYEYSASLPMTFALTWPSIDNETPEEYDKKTSKIIEKIQHKITQKEQLAEEL